MAIVIKNAPEYLIWEDANGWHVSQLKGIEDDYVKTARILLANHGINQTRKFFRDNGCTVEVHPLDDDLVHSKCFDTWTYERGDYATV